jgi:hypothetical protein
MTYPMMSGGKIVAADDLLPAEFDNNLLFESKKS